MCNTTPVMRRRVTETETLAQQMPKGPLSHDLSHDPPSTTEWHSQTWSRSVSMCVCVCVSNTLSQIQKGFRFVFMLWKPWCIFSVYYLEDFIRILEVFIPGILIKIKLFIWSLEKKKKKRFACVFYVEVSFIFDSSGPFIRPM